MQLTTNYQFKMPDQTDNYNIQNQNDNWASLDTIIKNLNTSITNAQNTASAAIPSSQIGVANGVAPLDANILVPSANLPKASSTALGAVKIGSGIAVASDGTISVATLPSDLAKLDVAQTWTADQTFNGKLITSHNTLDDGTGNATFAGNVLVPNNVSFQGKDASGNKRYISYIDPSNVSHFGDPSLAFKIDGTSINTKNNTLDDGNGNAIFGGSVTAQFVKLANDTASSVNTGIARIGKFDRPSGSLVVNLGNNGGTGQVFHVLDDAWTKVLLDVERTGLVKTLYNTLDDGTGAATFLKAIKTGDGTSNTGVVQLMPGNVGTWWWVDNNNGSFRVSQGTAPGAAAVALAINGANAVTTLKNTLDDGSGNATFAGTLTANNAIVVNEIGTSTKSGIFAGVAAAGNYLNGSNPGDTVLRNDANMNILFGFNGPGGVESPALKIGYNEGTGKATVSTQRNTLDDGSGNLSVAGNISKNTAGVWKIDGNGGDIQMSSSSGYVGVTDTTHSNWKFYVIPATGAVSTYHNTLDDGTGQAILTGHRTPSIKITSSGQTITSSAFGTLVEYAGPASGTLTIPDASTCSGAELTIWNNQTGQLTITSAGTTSGFYGPTGNGGQSRILNGNVTLRVISDGTNWIMNGGTVFNAGTIGLLSPTNGYVAGGVMNLMSVPATATRIKAMWSSGSVNSYGYNFEGVTEFGSTYWHLIGNNGILNPGYSTGLSSTNYSGTLIYFYTSTTMYGGYFQINGTQLQFVVVNVTSGTYTQSEFMFYID